MKTTLLTLIAALLSCAAHADFFQPTYDLTKAPGTAVDAPNVLAYGASSGAQTGDVVRAADINGDGVDDLIVGGFEANVVYVWFGKGALAGTKDAAGSAGTAPDVTILGASAGDRLTEGGALAAGDVNGDGTLDLIIGAPFADGPLNGRANGGEAYVVYGRKSPATFPATVDLAVQGAGGADVTIYGATAGDFVTQTGAVTVGDVNGDGTADILLGAFSSDGPANGRAGAGEAYIIYGRKSPASFLATVDLAVQGAGGADVTIYGATASDFLTIGNGLVAGDVNGDGTADIILSASFADGPADGRAGAGETYIVFGRKSPAAFPTTLDLAVQGNAGANVTIYGATADDKLTGGDLSSPAAIALGDVNGDGTEDLILGAWKADGPSEGRSDAGEAYIIYGRKSPATFPATLDLAVQGSTGADVTLYGATAGDNLAISGALTVGDVNGDGTTDILLGAAMADGPVNGRAGAGEAYVVFGRKSPAAFPAVLDLAVQGSTGANVTLYGGTSGDTLTAYGTLKVGDVNGDGTPDLILGTFGADGPANGRSDAGEAYIVFGRNSTATFPTTLDLAVQGSTGADVTIYGASADDILTSLGALALGDVNGDGTPDIILGAPRADGPAEGRSFAGEAYVVYGVAVGAPDIAVAQADALADGGSVAFGAVLVGGSSAAKTFTITNPGTGLLDSLVVTKDGANSGEFTVSALNGTSIPVGAGTVTFTVTFSPSSGGAKTAALHIASNVSGAKNPFDITLTATAGVPDIAVALGATNLTAGGTVDFGTIVGEPVFARTFTVNNNGALPLTYSAQIAAGAIFSITQGASGVVASGGSASIVVLYDARVGGDTGELRITSDDPDTSTFTVQLSGPGLRSLAGDALAASGPDTRFSPLANDGLDDTFTITDVSDPAIGFIGRTVLIPAGYVGTFTYDASNGTATGRGTVTVTAATPVVSAKTFTGLLRDANDEIIGWGTMTVSNGTATMQIRAGSVLVKTKLAVPGIVYTSLGNVVVGAMNNGHFPFGIQALGGSVIGTLRPARLTTTAEKHHIALASIQSVTLPGGGYAIANVSAKGAVKIVGVGIDGLPFTAATALSDNGSFSFYSAIIAAPKPPAFIGGELFLADLTPTDVTGELRHTKFTQLPTAKGTHKLGFDTLLTANGCRYNGTALIAAGAGTLKLSGGNLDTKQNSPVTIAASGVPTLPLTSSVKTWKAVSVKKGKFTVTVLVPGITKPVKGSGIYLPKSNSAWGYFPGTTDGGRIQLSLP